MSTEPINTSPIEQFLQQVKQAEASRSKDLRMDINSAKNLATTLGIVMTRLNGGMEKYIAEHMKKQESDQVIEISMDQGEW